MRSTTGGQSGVTPLSTPPRSTRTTGDAISPSNTTLPNARPANTTKWYVSLVRSNWAIHALRTRLRRPTQTLPNASPRTVCGPRPPQELLLLRRLRVMPLQRQGQRSHGPKRACLGGTGSKMEVDPTLEVGTARCDGRGTGRLKLV